MTQLLQDVFIVENLQVLTEGKNSDTMRIKGVFGRCNEKNNNGRIYPTCVLEGQLKKVQPLISERRLCGELDHPQNDTVKLSNASHLITKLEMKGNELIGEAEILKTPAGLTAKALVEGGVKIGISSRGMGTLSEDAQGNKIVNEDFRLVTFDLVADPSTRGAFPGLSESTQSQFARESQSKLEKESNFVTMLQSKLREAYDPWIEEAHRGKKKKAKKKKAKKGGFPDLTGDGELTQADILKGRGVFEGKDMMEAVKAEGSWHQIAYTLAEAFADELEKSRADSQKRISQSPDSDKGGILANMRARSQAKKMEIARAKGIAKGSKIIAKGDVKSARIRQKAQDAAAAGKPVTGGEKAADLAGKAGKAAAAAPGKVLRGAERSSKALKDAGTGLLRKAQARKISQDNIDARKKADRDARLAAASKPKTGDRGDGAKTPVDMSKVGETNADKRKKEVAGRAKMAAATADVKRRAGNKAATSAEFGRKGSFSAGVGATSKEDEASRQATRKAIARRERKTGKKVKLTPAQATQVEKKVYRQLGLHLAEAFGLIEGADAPMKGSRQEGQTEVRKASYNVQAQRKKNKASKEREKAKENR
jgi:hypothetical protein